MFTWFLFALGAAVTQSLYQATTKSADSSGKFSKFTIVFWAALVASLILYSVSFLVGFPEIKSSFWQAALITAVLNFFAGPIMLLGYELGAFSMVYSMLLLSPVFALLAGFIFLGEIPPLWGMAGVILTVAGLIMIVRLSEEKRRWNLNKGALLGIAVALIFSISSSFDKLSVLGADAFFAGAFIWGSVAVLNGAYLVFRKSNQGGTAEDAKALIRPRDWLILLLAGLILGANSIVYNFALFSGFVSYTIAIKRLGILFGVFWGWLFFHEKNISRKLLGAGIALAGVLLILFS